ncbi:MAG TPA: hypothetical protein VKJ45_04345 [Blastocatellia bacterium]|nr:hypothetical protein [Blastocatellia bacterium]
MIGPRSVHPDEWVPGDYRVAAAVNRQREYFEEHFGFRFWDDSEEGIGEFKVAGCLTSNNRQFKLTQYLAALTDKIEIDVLYFKESMTRDLEDILIDLELDCADLYWVHEAITLASYDVWRQDDNGNRYLVSADVCRPDAMRLMQRLESTKHKQTYWVAQHQPQ